MKLTTTLEGTYIIYQHQQCYRQHVSDDRYITTLDFEHQSTFGNMEY